MLQNSKENNCARKLQTYFPAFGLNTKYLSVFSPNAGKYGPEKTPYLDTFHTT